MLDEECHNENVEPHDNQHKARGCLEWFSERELLEVQRRDDCKAYRRANRVYDERSFQCRYGSSNAHHGRTERPTNKCMHGKNCCSTNRTHLTDRSGKSRSHMETQLARFFSRTTMARSTPSAHATATGPTEVQRLEATISTLCTIRCLTRRSTALNTIKI
jgi:hypothetical protein